ncbi:NrfD/PsrC family molybdoenzyme membrane anchor subunit [Frigoriglobus tundricola]|uniref:Formate dehydrogenase O putative subunit n=1 Tax=Frigoriglobus tundricola TaxID=2774151 RepID=A0A6M5Z417_9BACT|nr:NrfD/PsrC family molybdoenzyme membrane anchor subunit [Frigoriglobus tundricola]QJX00517.1 Formate dehydrogenase O putative subunit [Frigoriglobus tundricola]
MNAPTAAGYTAKEPTQPVPWHGLVVWDLFFNALTTGLFLTAAVGELAAPSAFASIAVWAYPLALVLLLTDLTFLVLDLGDPLRFHHMLRVFKPSSPMSLGTWCLTTYSLPLAAVVVIGLAVLVGVLPGDSATLGWIHKGLLVFALPFAFGSMAYKGVLFSTSSQPGWRDARWLGAYHVASGFALGSALLLALAAILRSPAATGALRPAVVALMIIQFVPLALLARELKPALAQRRTREQMMVAAALVFGVGGLFPLILLLFNGPVVDVAVAATALGGGWVVRHWIVMLPRFSLSGSSTH